MKNKSIYVFGCILCLGMFCGCGISEKNKTIESIDLDERGESEKICSEDSSIDPEPISDDRLHVFRYKGELYCGLEFIWDLEELPDDFEKIGTFQGMLSDKDITSTFPFDEGIEIYHYIDKDGYQYFCTHYMKDNTFIGLYKAEKYKEGFYVVENDYI